ncbi:flavodoxin domain-containing protein [Brachyspira pilosicoli]|uniref:flavodoxin domain-containing protein n=1 Tax=Brachyspira pilosicoli TaxID=52584 RepID=UPI0030045C6E
MNKKIAIVFWSKTGNTKLMANALKESIELQKYQADMFKAYNFDKNKAGEYSIIALGCPAMGAETLEESEFLPMYNNIKPVLKNKRVFLFGSYSWGDGKWMRDWVCDAKNNGIILFREPIIAKDKPTDDILLKIKKVGIDLLSD